MRQKPARHVNSRPVFAIFRWWVLGGIMLVGIGLWQLYQTSVFFRSPWRTNLVLNTNPIVVVSLPKAAEDQMLIITLPENAFTDVPFGYGAYKLSSVWRLGEIEKNPELFVTTIEDMLGVRIDGWLAKTEVGNLTQTDNLRQKLDQFLASPLKPANFKSNINHLDWAWIYFKLRFSRPDKFKLLLSETYPSLYADAILPDGTQIQKVNHESLLRFLEQKFEDIDVRRDGLSVVIQNHTDIPNVGQKFARFVTNFGGKVITIGNGIDRMANCRLEVKPELTQKKLVQYLMRAFKCELVATAENSGVDMTVKLGDTFGQRWRVSVLAD